MDKKEDSLSDLISQQLGVLVFQCCTLQAQVNALKMENAALQEENKKLREKPELRVVEN